MRALVRDKIKITEDLDLSKLKGRDKIVCAIRYRYYNSAYNQKKIDKEKNKQLEENMKKQEQLKGVLLNQFRRLLISNNKVESIVVSVDRKFDSVIDDTLKMTDFISFIIKRYEENKDYLLAFPDLPIMLEVRKRV